MIKPNPVFITLEYEKFGHEHESLCLGYVVNFRGSASAVHIITFDSEGQLEEGFRPDHVANLCQKASSWKPEIIS